MPLVLSPPPLALRLRQNKRPYGYAGVVVHRSSAAAPSTSMYSFEVGPVVEGQGILLEVVKLPEAKRGFVLLPHRWVVERT